MNKEIVRIYVMVRYLVINNSSISSSNNNKSYELLTCVVIGMIFNIVLYKRIIMEVWF